MADWYDMKYHETRLSNQSSNLRQSNKKSNKKSNNKTSNKDGKKETKLSSKTNLELSIKHGIIKCQRTIERKEKEIADDRLYYCSHCKKIDIQVCRCMYLEWCGTNEDSDYCIYNDIKNGYEYGCYGYYYDFLDKSCMYHYYFNKDLKKELISKLEMDYKGKKHIYKNYVPVQRHELEIISGGLIRILVLIFLFNTVIQIKLISQNRLDYNNRNILGIY